MRLVFFLLMVQLSIFSYSQEFYRICADFSIKTKNGNGEEKLVIGKVYYDKFQKKIVHVLSFPRSETWITVDSMMVQMDKKTKVQQFRIPPIASISIFHIALSGNLADYGMKKTNYKISSIENESDMVITTWIPPEKYQANMGKIMVSTKQNRLFGVIYFSPSGKILNKHFFSKYINIKGFDFPSEVLQISYVNETEHYEMTTYKNIIINETTNMDMYNYIIPD